MPSILSRLIPRSSAPEPLKPGLYHTLAPQDAAQPYRLHLRVESDGNGILIVNAATVLHLNPSATEHAWLFIQGKAEGEAAQIIASRFRVDYMRALTDHQALCAQILTIATTQEIDPVLFLDMDRTDPYPDDLSAPYRLDLALTYRTAPGAAPDPRVRRRVDRELTSGEWKQIMEKAWQAGIPHLTFTGGEPTLREDVADLVSHGEKLGQVTGLLTDGRRLSDAAYLASLSMAGLDHILVTLDPSDPSSMAGLKAAIASDVFTVAHLTLSPTMSLDVPKLIEELRTSGLAAISLSASDDSIGMARGLGEARAAAARLGVPLVWDLPAPYSNLNPLALELETPPQGAGRAFLYVEPDGDVLPGQGIDHVLGNLLRDDWASIWAATKQPA